MPFYEINGELTVEAKSMDEVLDRIAANEFGPLATEDGKLEVVPVVIEDIW